MTSDGSFSGPRVAICPATGRPEEIEIDAARAAITSATGRSELQVRRCSRWPAHHDCDQACLNGLDPRWVEEHGLLTPPPRGGRALPISGAGGPMPDPCRARRGGS